MAKGAVKVKINTKAIKNLKKLYSPFGGGGHSGANSLQAFIDSSIARHSDNFAPSDTIALRKSVFLLSNFGSGYITYRIYGNPKGRNSWTDVVSKFQDAPRRGSYWVPRMLDAGGREKLLQEIERFIGRK